MGSHIFAEANQYRFTINGWDMPINPQSMVLEGDSVSVSYPTLKNANASLLKLGHGDIGLMVSFLVGNPRIATPKGLGEALNNSVKKIWYWAKYNPFFVLSNELLNRSMEANGQTLWSLTDMSIRFGDDIPASLCGLDLQFSFFEYRPYIPDLQFRKEYALAENEPVRTKYQLSNPVFSQAAVIPSGTSVQKLSGDETTVTLRDISFGELYANKVNYSTTPSLGDSKCFDQWLHELIRDTNSFPEGKEITSTVSLTKMIRDIYTFKPDAQPPAELAIRSNVGFASGTSVMPSVLGDLKNSELSPNMQTTLNSFLREIPPENASPGSKQNASKSYPIFLSFVIYAQKMIEVVLGIKTTLSGCGEGCGWGYRSSAISQHPQGRALDITGIDALGFSSSSTFRGRAFDGHQNKNKLIKIYAFLGALWFYFGEIGLPILKIVKGEVKSTGEIKRFPARWGGFFTDHTLKNDFGMYRGGNGYIGDFMHFDMCPGINNNISTDSTPTRALAAKVYPYLKGLRAKNYNMAKLLDDDTGVDTEVDRLLAEAGFSNIDSSPAPESESSSDIDYSPAPESESSSDIEATVVTGEQVINEQNANWQLQQFFAMQSLQEEGWTIVDQTKDGRSLYIERLDKTITFGGRDSMYTPIVRGINISYTPRVASFQLAKHKHPTKQFLGGGVTNVSISLFFPKTHFATPAISENNHGIREVLSIFEEDTNYALKDRFWRRGAGVEITNDVLRVLGISRVVYKSHNQLANTPEGTTLLLNLQPGPTGKKKVQLAASLDSTASFYTGIIKKLCQRAKDSIADEPHEEDAPREELPNYGEGEEQKQKLESSLVVELLRYWRTLKKYPENKVLSRVYTQAFFEGFDLDRTRLANTDALPARVEATNKAEKTLKSLTIARNQTVQAKTIAEGILAMSPKDTKAQKIIADADRDLARIDQRIEETKLEAQRQRGLGDQLGLTGTAGERTLPRVETVQERIDIDRIILNTAPRSVVEGSVPHLPLPPDKALDLESNLRTLLSSPQMTVFLKSNPTPYKPEIDKFNGQLSVVLAKRSNYEHLLLPPNPIDGSATLNPGFYFKRQFKTGAITVEEDEKKTEELLAKHKKGVRDIFNRLTTVVMDPSTTEYILQETQQTISELEEIVHVVQDKSNVRSQK